MEGRRQKRDGKNRVCENMKMGERDGRFTNQEDEEKKQEHAIKLIISWSGKKEKTRQLQNGLG